MAVSTITSVTLPGHLYPHIETRINDNSVRRYTTSTAGNYRFLAVGLSPKGEDGVLHTITGGLDEYDDLFGHGPCSIYGQAHLNTRAAAATGRVTLQVLRLTAPNAAYANAHVYVSYRLVPCTTPSDTPVEPGTAAETMHTYDMQVVYTLHHTTGLKDLSTLASSAPDVSDINTKLTNALNVEGATDWNTMRFLSVAYKGRGKCGNNFGFKIDNHGRADRSSNYKNYYFNIYEGSSVSAKEAKRISFYPDALVGSTSIYAENVINSYGGDEGSKLFAIDINDDAIKALYSEYVTSVDPKTSLKEYQFDPLLGINKVKADKSSYNASIDAIRLNGFYIIDKDSLMDTELKTIHFDPVFSNKLAGGDDGEFDINWAGEPGIDSEGNQITVTRADMIDREFIKAFNGEIVREIKSKNRCPLDYACDANFNKDVKLALEQLAEDRRQDFRVYFDLGTNLMSRSAPLDVVSGYDTSLGNNSESGWLFSIDAYAGKIKDPYNKKVIDVTSTYHLAQALPMHWNFYGGFHIPHANSKYGIISSFLPNTVYPVYDDTIDSDILDEFVVKHVNYAAIDPKGNIMRATQTTRYSGVISDNTFAESDDYVVSNLSEENNALITLAIKKDVEQLICTYLYNFNEPAGISAFNSDLSTLTSKYAAAQVHSITAQFARTEEEAELGILHLYIALQHKPLIKYLQVDIDVNRLVTE